MWASPAHELACSLYLESSLTTAQPELLRPPSSLWPPSAQRTITSAPAAPGDPVRMEVFLASGAPRVGETCSPAVRRWGDSGDPGRGSKGYAWKRDI